MTNQKPLLLLLDGRAGSGKTTLAEGLGDMIDAQIVHMDDLTPGWEGLQAASIQLERLLDGGQVERYDWVQGRSDGVITVDRSRSLIVEGCGSLTLGTKRFATHSIWVEADDALRRERALTRDGAMFAEHWDTWAEQELAHQEINTPRLLADAVLRVDRADTQHDKLAECYALLF